MHRIGDRPVDRGANHVDRRIAELVGLRRDGRTARRCSGLHARREGRADEAVDPEYPAGCGRILRHQAAADIAVRIVFAVAATAGNVAAPLAGADPEIGRQHEGVVDLEALADAEVFVVDFGIVTLAEVAILAADEGADIVAVTLVPRQIAVEIEVRNDEIGHDRTRQRKTRLPAAFTVERRGAAGFQVIEIGTADVESDLIVGLDDVAARAAKLHVSRMRSRE